MLACDMFRRAFIAALLAATPSLAQPVAVPRPPHRAPTRLEGTSRRPSWPRFEATIERVAPGYLSFRDAEHVTRYVEARATLEIEASRSVEERLKA